MRFTVTWKPSAQAELASLWLAASSADRRVITAAAHEIDKALSVDAQSQGESRAANRRILFVPPLVVIFTISEPDRTVSVLTVGRV